MDDHRGVAALEFALVLPLMLALVFGVYELSEPMIINQEVYAAAHSIAASASSLAVQADGSTSLTYAQVQFEASTIFAEIPALRAGQQGYGAGDTGVTISAVVFEPTTTGCVPGSGVTCNYTANVVWSVAYTGGDSGLVPYEGLLGQRGCQALGQTPPAGDPLGTTPSAALATLPTQGVTTNATSWPDPILVVDASVKYQPLLLTYTKTPFYLLAIGFWPVRSVKAASVDANGNATPLLADQQYTTLTGLQNAPSGSYCVNPNYAEPGT
ncbi:MULTISPECIES: TadE/TadG family type IV pilus assembly protein [unclassified Acidiphilium]|uniref:TadE/TadG family type IV pilus assembly protein n=1 Tax=unclassified Acidiphilium TaxID=2617493 RepID=UPI00257A34A9|nr:MULTISPECIES: TadE/TadG family type IV pilus assembly protein [unclassified Acidiphilium]HQT83711.1 TadE/TadG family type IV pilus assembly protein [Acidiphilium rubrum]